MAIDSMADYLATQQMLADLRAEEARKRQTEEQNQQQGGGGMNPQGHNIYSNYIQPNMGTTPVAGSTAPAASTAAAPEAGAGGAGAGSGTGLGTSAAYGAGWIAAAIAAGKLASYFTHRETNGVQTGTILEGRGFTDPFLPLVHQWAGFEDATPGEKLDADLKRENWTGLKKSIPDYLMHLGTPWNATENAAIDEMGFLPDWSKKGLKWVANPVHQLFKSIL
jgi:hypothetical protein